jgi:hypothetical protein
MRFVNWLARIIAQAVAGEVILLLKDYFETEQKLSAIGAVAKDLLTELDNAQSESERKAILRKLSAFSDLKRLL